MKQVAYELHVALRKAGEKGPYTLVGHSLGGLLVRVYANQYPKEVAGLVLVDSTHEDTVLMFKGQLKRMRELAQDRPLPPLRTTITPAEKELSAEEKQQVENILKQRGALQLRAPYNRLPAELQTARLWALGQPRSYTANNAPYLSEEFAEMYAARQPQPCPLGEKPLVVLRPGSSGNPPPGIAAAEWQRLNEEKREQNVDFTKLSRNSKLIVAERSGHHIHLGEPAIVIGAIRQVVEAAPRRIKLRP
jgi:pimeloyl-ACP methyl ester carboxylesterase